MFKLRQNYLAYLFFKAIFLLFLKSCFYLYIESLKSDFIKNIDKKMEIYIKA